MPFPSLPPKRVDTKEPPLLLERSCSHLQSMTSLVLLAKEPQVGVWIAADYIRPLSPAHDDLLPESQPSTQLSSTQLNPTPHLNPPPLDRDRRQRRALPSILAVPSSLDPLLLEVGCELPISAALTAVSGLFCSPPGTIPSDLPPVPFPRSLLLCVCLLPFVPLLLPPTV